MGRTDKEIYRVIDNVNSYYRINSESKKELLLNKYPNAAAAYSLRLLDGYYRDPLVRVRRDDGVEVDVYPDYNNQLSLDSLVTNVPVHTTNDGIPDEDYTFQLSLSSLGEFVGATGYSSTVAATDATVCVWYDQSSTDGVPNANDAKQVVATSQPLIVSSGIIVTENGRPAIEFGLGNARSMTGSITLSQPMTYYVAAKSESSSGVNERSLFIEDSGNTHTWGIDINGRAVAVCPSVILESTGQTRVGTELFTFVCDGASSAIYTDGNLSVSGDAGSNGLTGTQGVLISRGDRPPAYVHEFVLFNNTLNRTEIEEDINDFYQIDGYEPQQPLIDLTQQLAVQNGDTIADGTPAAAYSLRLLSSTYNGPLVRIRRTIDNTEVDVYPDSDGEFSIYSTIEDGGTELTTGVTGGSTDKTTLHEFLYGQDTDCMVVRWYDQASGNHATQDVATSQPKIYDSLTGVIIEGINPAIDWASSNMTMPASVGANFSIAWVWRSDNAGLNQLILNTQVDCYWNPNSVYRLYFGGTIYDFGISEGAVLPTTYSVVWQNYSTLETWYMRSNGNEKSFTAGASYTPASGSIGQGVDGRIQEIIIWNSNQSSNRITIESNINQHYNIY